MFNIEHTGNPFTATLTTYQLDITLFLQAGWIPPVIQPRHIRAKEFTMQPLFISGSRVQKNAAFPLFIERSCVELLCKRARLSPEGSLAECDFVSRRSTGPRLRKSSQPACVKIRILAVTPRAPRKQFVKVWFSRPPSRPNLLFSTPLFAQTILNVT